MATIKSTIPILPFFFALSMVFIFMGGMSMGEDAREQALRDSPGREGEMGQMIRSTLEEYGIQPTPEGLMKGLNHPNASARSFALMGLALVGDNSALQTISKMVDAPERNVKIQAMLAMNAIVSRETKKRIERLYEEANNAVDQFEIAVLSCKLGYPGKFRDVLAVLHDSKDPLLTRAVREVPLFAKYQLFEDGKPVDWVTSVSAILTNKTTARMARQSAANALAEIGSREGWASLKAALPNETDPTVKYIMETALKQRPEGP